MQVVVTASCSVTITGAGCTSVAACSVVSNACYSVTVDQTGSASVSAFGWYSLLIAEQVHSPALLRVPTYNVLTRMVAQLLVQ